MVTNRVDINNVLMQMRELKAQAAGEGAIRPRSDVEAALTSDKVTSTNKTPEFSDMFKTAIQTVHETQQSASTMASAYERGDATVSLSQVMVASQKASVSFQALTQVRNKLVEAYQDIMNMPI